MTQPPPVELLRLANALKGGLLTASIKEFRDLAIAIELELRRHATQPAAIQRGESVEYEEVVCSIAKAIGLGAKPLTGAQRTCLAGSVAVWVDRLSTPPAEPAVALNAERYRTFRELAMGNDAGLHDMLEDAHVMTEEDIDAAIDAMRGERDE